MTEIKKSDPFYRPDSRPVLKPKRGRISPVERGYRMAVLDPKLSVALRIEALGHLARLHPPQTFLTRLVRKTDTPGRLRLEATRLLEKVQTAATGLHEAERRAEAVLADIRGRKAAAEPVESVFGGLD